MTVIQLAVLQAAKKCEQELARGRVTGKEKLAQMQRIMDWRDSILKQLEARGERET